MSTYLISIDQTAAPAAAQNAVVLKVGFNPAEPANNDRLVPDALQALAEAGVPQGVPVIINGPASLPVAMALSHALAHTQPFIAGFDPKMGGYVVCVAHGDGPKAGDFIPA